MKTACEHSTPRCNDCQIEAMYARRKALVPTEIRFEIDVRAENQQAVRDALLATLMAIRHDVEPNTLWGSGFCVAVKVGK